jgi:amidase
MVYPPHHETLPHLTKDNWREHAAKKKQSTLDAIPKEWRFDAAKYAGQKNVIDIPRQTGILSDKDIEITEIDDANQLAAKLADGSYTAVDVTTAYLKRAAVAHQLVNCEQKASNEHALISCSSRSTGLTEFFPERALAQAKKLDEYRQKNGKTVGPLHGVPISLKDQFDIKGMELTMGYASYLGRISPENACLVDLLEAAGAVLYVRTNIPQTLMIGDTFNHVFGRTDNPWQRELSPGGSSGGEGALVALKGSICGVVSRESATCLVPDC